MGGQRAVPYTLFAQVTINLRERQAAPGEGAHARHKAAVLLARLAWQRFEFGLGVVHGLKLVLLLHPRGLERS